MIRGKARRRVTIHDVAQQAGVSITTVSHALNGKGVVASKTRQRIIEVADDLGYSADAVARGLRGSRLGVLGLVIRPLDTLDSYQPEGVDYFMRFAGAAAIEALDRGYGLMLVRDPSTKRGPDIALAVDGFIIADPIANDPVIALLNRKQIPLVTVGRDIARPEFTDWVGAGGTADAGVVLDHLKARGARRIALVTGTDANAWNADSEAAYREWTTSQRMPAVVRRQDERSGAAGGRMAATSLLASGDELPDAIYCLTGRHAAGVQACLQEAGLDVPSDVMIVAGSDSEQTRNSSPPITSVDLVPETTAKAAVDFLLQRLDEDDECSPPSVDNLLRIRESTNRLPRPESLA